MKRRPVHVLDPEGAPDGRVPVTSGGKFVIGAPAFDAEAVRDAIAAALVPGTSIVTITVNDPGDTITIAVMSFVTATGTSGDFVDVWTDEGNHLYVEGPV